MRELFAKYRVEIAPGGHEHVTRGWISVDCPWCSPGWRHYRLGYNEYGHYMSCWSCGGVPLVKTCAELFHVSYTEASRLIGEIDRKQFKQEFKTRGVLQLPPNVEPLLPTPTPAHYKYLKGRFGDDTFGIIKLWHLQAIKISHRLPWRIFIPIHYRGEMVSWTTRAIVDDVRPRYKSANADEEMYPAKSLLYGEDHVRQSVIVCEGPTDVWAIGPGAVATFGTAFTLEQVKRIAKYPRRVILFDSEPAAQKQARKLCRQLEVLDGDTFHVTLAAKDPGSAKEKEIKKLRKTFLE